MLNHRNLVRYGYLTCAGLFGLILLVLNIWSMHKPLQVNAAEQQANIQGIVSPTPNPNRGLQFSEGFEKALQLLEVDLTCRPACWFDTIPGTTPMGEIFSWFDETYSGYILESTKGDRQAPNNAIGSGATGLGVVAFSDDTQPEPLLRAYLLKIAIPNDIPISEVNLKINDWLPQNILKGQDRPQSITFGEPIKGNYYLLIEFDTWAVEYHGSQILSTVRNNQLISCPAERIPVIQIWVYSDQETDAITLIHSINNYEKMYGDIYYLRDQSKMKTLTENGNIGKFTGLLNQTGCIPTYEEVQQAK